MRQLSLLLLAVMAASCGSAPPFLTPEFLEVRLVSNTNETQGGQEVVVVARYSTGVTAVYLFFSGSPDWQTAPAATQHMRWLETDPQSRGERYTGVIQTGFPIGTTVRYAVQACNRLGVCATSPAGWPTREAYAFVIGELPSNPHVLQAIPERGPTVGGIRVEIVGEDFRPGMQLSFDGVPATHVEVARTNLAYVTLPPGSAGAVDVTARNPDGQKGTLRRGFTYYETPRPIRVIPDHGPTSGDTPVVIEGEFFVPGVRVTFEGRHATHVEFINGNRLTCNTPPGNAGFADVAVEHPEGGEGVLEDGYRYIPPPIVEAVLPPEGPDFGGQTITIMGENFEEGATVTVGTSACTNVVFVSEMELTCTVPPGETGAADVTVVNPDQQQGTLPGGYYYNGPPVVIQVDPPEGPVVGGIEVDVLGAGFLPGVTVSFDGRPATVLGTVSRDRIHVKIPSLPPDIIAAIPESGERPVDVKVVNALPDGRQDTLQAGFLYLWPPEVQSANPPQGPTAGGTDVQLTGRFFRRMLGGELKVRFDGVDATNISLVSRTEMHVITPPGQPGPADVDVENHPLSIGTGAGIYTYVPPPRVDNVTPPDGPTFGGDVVTVHGAFFQDGASVSFDGAPCVNVVVAADGNSLTCTTPPGDLGPADVKVTNPDNQSGVLLAGYTYLPLVVRPNGGFEAGFTHVHVIGAGMREGVRVTFGNTLATDVQRISERELLVQSPPHALGLVSVTFRNVDGTGETAQDAFTYRTLSNRQPNRVPSEFLTGNDAEVADVDKDGDLDIVVGNGDVNQPEDSVVLTNDGTGRFDSTVYLSFLVNNQVSLGDLNGDGFVDLLSAASSEGHLHFNDGTGRFNEVGMVNAGDGAFEGVIADLNADGRNDIFLLNIGCSEAAFGAECDSNVRGRDTLLIGQGGGAFDDQSSRVPHDRALVHDHKVEIADLDGDGRNDLIIVADNKDFEGPPGFGTTRHRVLMNHANGFEEQDPPDLTGLIGDVYGIAMGDLDGDGHPDLVLPNYIPSRDGSLGFPGTPGSTAILMGRGGPDFVRDDSRLGLVNLDEPTINTNVCDLDDDGDQDIIIINLGGISRILVNHGNGTFTPADSALPPNGEESADMVCGDFDRDGDKDVFMVNHGQDILLLAGPER